VAILGPNGAGKTTLLNTLAGLIRPEEGEVWLGAVRLDGLPAHEVVAHGVALAPEGGALFLRMSVRENLLMGAYRFRGMTIVEERLESIYAMFPVLREREAQRVESLSGGERQMVSIGRALMSRPPLLLLDEPSTGLAPVVVQQIFRTLRDIHKAGTAILLAEQSVHMALQVTSRASILRGGRIVLTDQSAKLLADPRVQAEYLAV
jgi:branched-chain amino acid transport system ATP-binding protein